MKNIFITAQYDVENRYSHNAETTKDDYRQLTNICTKSFRENLVGLDEVIILNGTVEDYHQLFKEIYWKIREIYHNQECNIIWSDSDNLCLKPLDIYGKWDKFAMFFSAHEYCDAFVYESCKVLTEKLRPWMMANLRYYPAGMDNQLWEIGDDLAYSWIHDWAYETIIYNKMFHSQGITDFKKYHIPAWNVQCEGPVGMISPEMVRDVTIIHCQSTRGSREAIDKMNRAISFMKGF